MRIVARYWPKAYGLAGVCGVAGALFAWLALVIATRGAKPLAAIGPGALAALLGWGVVVLVRPSRITVTDGGVQRAGGLIAWRQIERFWAEELGGVIRLFARVGGQPRIWFTSQWENWAQVAACIHARRCDPDAQLEVEALLGEAPRGDPAVALGVAPAMLQKFLEAVKIAAGAAGVTLQIDAELLRGKSDEGFYELFSIGRACVAAPESEWPGALRDYFDRIAKSREETRRALDEASSLEQVRDRMAIQLHRRHTLPRTAVTRSFGEHLVGTVVLETPHGDVTMTQKLEAWKVGADEAWNAALASLRARAKPAAVKRGRLLTFEGDSFTAARALSLVDLVPDLDVKLGAFIAMPSQMVLLVLPIHDLGDTMALTFEPTLWVSAAEIFARDPKPVSPEIWWWRPEELVRVPHLGAPDGTHQFVLPSDLTGRLVGRIG